MKSGLKKYLITFSITFFAAGIIIPTVFADEALELLPPRIVEVAPESPRNECGNGIREFGEQCDEGELNGTDESICGADCVYDLTDEEKECIRRKLEECIEAEGGGLVLVRDRGELIREVGEGDELILEAAVPEEAELEEEAEEIAEPDRGPSLEDCLEEAIEECREPEDEPEVPEIPQSSPEPENSTFDQGPGLMFHGGACSLNPAGGSAGSLIWLLGLGLGIFPTLRKRR